MFTFVYVFIMHCGLLGNLGHAGRPGCIPGVYNMYLDCMLAMGSAGKLLRSSEDAEGTDRERAGAPAYHI